ncbi:MAG: mechanosensitive ion channel family protein [Thermomicrobiales bacterium]|nr:mechanosensitive ion channel family protein [Thermomicrobiales bacterium]
MLPDHLSTMQIILIIALGVVVIVLLAFMLVPWLRMILTKTGFGHPYLLAFLEKGRFAARAFVMILGMQGLLHLLETSDVRWPSPIYHLLTILLIAAVTWFFCAVVLATEELLLSKISWQEAGQRRIATQVLMIRRILLTIIVLAGMWAVLMTFPQVQSFGQTLLASAGLLSIIAGLAAQTTLTNVFAGIQLVFTNAIRVDDFICVDDQTGRVDDITMTYVVIRPWDDRKLIYPTSYFISHSFENWTQIGDPIQGSTEIEVDWLAPIEELRQELKRVLGTSRFWDGREGTMVVTEVLDGKVQLLITLSASSASNLFSLKSEVREALVTYVVQHAPQAIPRARYVVPSRPDDHQG